MSFQEEISKYKVGEIVDLLGCPRQTAYAWRDGSRKPPEWQQVIFLLILRRLDKFKG